VRRHNHYSLERARVEHAPYFPYVHRIRHVHLIAMSLHEPFCSLPLCESNERVLSPPWCVKGIRRTGPTPS
jgi:hypothetical protein